MIWRIVPVSYWVLVVVTRFALWLYIRRIDVIGMENVPKQGGVLLVSNHINNADVCVAPGIMKRRIVFMAKREIFSWPIVSILFRLMGAFPVDRRQADLGALREATRLVNGGLPLLIFPEGARSKDAQLRRGFPGVALIAYRTGAPIVPMAITGTETIPWPWVFIRPFMGPKVVVRIGKPFYPPKAERISAEAASFAMDEIMGHIADLLPEQYRGEYRGDPAVGASDDTSLRASG
jgi:1-acyl-sn-glycerol-3-phosphate acyltransferase